MVDSLKRVCSFFLNWRSWRQKQTEKCLRQLWDPNLIWRWIICTSLIVAVGPHAHNFCWAAAVTFQISSGPLISSGCFYVSKQTQTSTSSRGNFIKPLGWVGNVGMFGWTFSLECLPSHSVSCAAAPCFWWGRWSSWNGCVTKPEHWPPQSWLWVNKTYCRFFFLKMFHFLAFKPNVIMWICV